MAWDPDQYRRFEAERNRPLRDLLNGLDDLDPRNVVDAGCGPGNSTEALIRRFPTAHIRAFDSDAAMVDAARKRLPGIAIDRQDVTRFEPEEPIDLFLSNAVFHWVPDHLPVLKRLAGFLVAGGALALQMPDNLDEPSHRLMAEVAAWGRWAAAFAEGMRRGEPLPWPATYMDRLGAAGLDVTVWRTAYFHRLADAAGIVEFVSGAGLRPWIARIEETLGPEAASAYRAAYQVAVARAYPPLADGSVAFSMPRLFLVARKRA